MQKSDGGYCHFPLCSFGLLPSELALYDVLLLCCYDIFTTNLAKAKVEPLNSELTLIVTIFVSFVLLIIKYNHFYQLFSLNYKLRAHYNPSI